jgi:hypothetical protein
MDGPSAMRVRPLTDRSRSRWGKRPASERPTITGLVPTSPAALFAWLISHQPTVLLSHNKPATSNQPAVLFSQNKPAPAISHQPTKQAVLHSPLHRYQQKQRNKERGWGAGVGCRADPRKGEKSTPMDPAIHRRSSGSRKSD